jgi:hypothetical protein
MANAQERSYLANNMYADITGPFGFPTGVSQRGFYTLTVASDLTTQSTVTATTCWRTPGRRLHGTDPEFNQTPATRW